MKRLGLVMGILGLGLVAGCGDDSTVSFSGGNTSSTSGGGGEGTGGNGMGGTMGNGGSTGTTMTGSSSSSSTGAGGGGQMDVHDPNIDGPYTFKEIDDPNFTVPATNVKEAIHCAYPTGGPSAGPYPVVIVAHGFQLAPSQYYGYVKRLASFGYVALTMDFPTSFAGVNNTDAAKNVAAALDWVAGKPELMGNVNLAGATGHSLGGKLAMHTAVTDARVKASIVLDPVDGAPGNPINPNPACNLPECIDVSAELPINKPTGFVGETLDSTAGGFGQACAPAAENFLTFYTKTTAPSLAVTVNGANHMSFLDDVSSCGFACSACKMATLDNKTVNDMSKAFVVAFYERYLRGNTGYDTYLTGAQAQARYVANGQAKIESK